MSDVYGPSPTPYPQLHPADGIRYGRVNHPQPGPGFTDPMTRASFSFVGNFPRVARAHPSSSTRPPHLLKPLDLLFVPKRRPP